MTTVCFEVAGKPQPKQRPRFSPKTGRVYTPEETHKYERTVRFSYRVRYNGMVSEHGPIWATVKCYFPIPESVPKLQKELMMSGRIRPTNRRTGDVDNLAKSVLDALNGVAYTDDSQIVSLTAEKWYVTQPDGEPLVDVILSGHGGACT